MLLSLFRFLVRRVAGDEFGLVLALLSWLSEGSKKNGVVVWVGSSHDPRYASTSNKIGVGGVTANIGLGVIEEEDEEDKEDANGKSSRWFEPSICLRGFSAMSPKCDGSPRAMSDGFNELGVFLIYIIIPSKWFNRCCRANMSCLVAGNIQSRSLFTPK